MKFTQKKKFVALLILPMVLIGFLLFQNYSTTEAATSTSSKESSVKHKNDPIPLPYTKDKNVEYEKEMSYDRPYWGHKITDTVQYQQAGYTQVKYFSEAVEGVWDEEYRTEIYYTDNTGLYLVDVIDFTNKNIIDSIKKKVKKKDMDLLLKFPVKKGSKWSTFNDKGEEFKNEIIDIAGVKKFPIGTLTDLVVVKSIDPLKATRLYYYHKDFGLVYWELWANNNTLKRISVLNKIKPIQDIKK